MSGEDAARSTAPTLKLSKENFVSYHSGTNLTELCFLFALVPFLAFMLQSHSRPCQSGFVRVVLQSAWVVLPTVLAVMSDTLVCAWLLFVLVLMSVTACWSRLPRYVAMTRSLHHLAEQHSKRSGTDSKAFEPVLACATSNVTPAQHSYITSVRGTTVLCTAICILAVDFHAFPRRFCKAEKFGQGKFADVFSIHINAYSNCCFESIPMPCDVEQCPASLLASGLMDIGVGAFIFSSGISTRAAPLSECAKPYKGIVRSLERNSVLLILGKHCLLHMLHGGVWRKL